MVASKPVSAASEINHPAREPHFPGSPNLLDVVNDQGERWNDVRRRLVPNYERVWRDIAGCYIALAGGFTLHIGLSHSAGILASLLTTPLAALWMGYWIAALATFVHEAAHFNIHRDKGTNDRLADLLLCPLAGTEIASYREVHWQHHLYLGTARDTEVSYRERPDLHFVVRSLLGLKVLEVLRTRSRVEAQPAARRGRGQIFGLLRSAALHGAIVVATLLAGLYTSALAWMMATAMVYPFCNALRQTLEHRPGDAGTASGESVGAVNRLFGADLLSRTFGAAGFNRHLLHHWYPVASYTNFDEIEAFLSRTPFAPTLAAARSSYWQVWRELATGTAAVPSS